MSKKVLKSKEIKTWEEKTREDLKSNKYELERYQDLNGVLLRNFKKEYSEDSYGLFGEIESIVSRNIDKYKKNIKIYTEQLKCKHEVREQYEGHDSHKEYYVDKCKKCDAVISNYSL